MFWGRAPPKMGIPGSADDDVIVVMTTPLVATELLVPDINSAAER